MQSQTKEVCLLVITLKSRPDLLALAQYNPQRYPALFQSLGKDLAQPQQGNSLQAHSQWDLLCVANGEQIVTNAEADGSFFAELESRFGAAIQPKDLIENAPPFIGGWVVYLGYEMSDEIEPRLQLLPPILSFRGLSHYGRRE